MKKIAPILLAFISQHALAQNLPSLLTGKNIYSTFSITAYDSAAQEWAKQAALLAVDSLITVIGGRKDL